MAIYNEQENLFYILYYGVENMPSLLLLEASHGDDAGNNWNLHNHAIGDWSHLINGMVWRDSNQTEIIFSGYHLDANSTTPGWPLLIEVDVTASVQGVASSQWYLYDTPFDGSDLQGVNFDYVVQPVNYSSSASSTMLNQLYYQPKGLVHTAHDEGYQFKFTSPQQNSSGDPLGLSFLNMIDDLGHSSCVEVTRGYYRNTSLNGYNNFISRPHNFGTIKHNLHVMPSNTINSLTCRTSLPKSTLGTESFEKLENDIAVYPNPATDLFNMSGLSDIKNAEISLYDLQGRVIYTQSANGSSNEAQLDISSLQNGIYFICISSSGETVFQERVLKK